MKTLEQPVTKFTLAILVGFSSFFPLKVVEYLLKNGACVHARDRSDDSPLKCAIDGGHKDVIA